MQNKKAPVRAPFRSNIKLLREKIREKRKNSKRKSLEDLLWNGRTLLHSGGADHHGAAGLRCRRQPQHLGYFLRLVPYVRLHVSANGDERGVRQNAAVDPVLLPLTMPKPIEEAYKEAERELTSVLRNDRKAANKILSAYPPFLISTL